MATKSTTGSRKSAPRSRPKSAETTAAPVAADAPPAVKEPVLRKKELFDRVVAATGAKRNDVKLIVEATLDALGKALASGEALALPPLGRARVHRQKDLASGEMLMVKLRRGGAGGGQSEAANEALEEAAE